MNTIINQFESMLDKGILPILEYKLSNGEYLTVEVTITDRQSKQQGVVFNLSEDLETSFSGNVETFNGNFLLPYDECFDNLDYYLEEINSEIIEGVLIPNDLFGE
jgi:hypothetical protein